MATPDAGGPSRQPHVATDIDGDPQTSDSDLTNHGHGFGQWPDPVCRWRTWRFHDRECSRYFDCPSHVVERALSDTEQGSEGEQEEEGREREDVESAHVRGHPSPDAISPLSEVSDENDGDHRRRSPSLELPIEEREGTAATLSSLRPSEAVETEREGPGEGSSGPGFPGEDLSFRPETRTETETSEATGSGTRDVDSRGFTSPALRPIGGGSGTTPRTPAINISAAGPTPPTRLVSRPSPTLSTPTESVQPLRVALPRWQPDSEVTYCPICGTQFSIFVRKHHCRKCGRVVCNSCSPHRITIPHQYIVRPPGAPPPLAQGPSLSLLDSQGWYPEFGGGERVRLCNPCVPDPNTAPPQTPGGQTRSPTNLVSPLQADSTPLTSRWSFYFGAGAANDAQTRSRSATMQPGPSSSSRPLLPPHRGNEGRVLWGTPPAYQAASGSRTSQRYTGVGPRYQSMLNVGDRPGPSSAADPSSSSSTAGYRFHSPVVPRPQIAEEDECPVCHRELPPRTLPNFESLREAHINSCITSHSRYGGPATTSPAGEADVDDPDMLPSLPPRRTGMFPYTATEKDCVDSAECSICLEEFEVGVAMARLECLCRFHRACINAWWERHPGRCPMHQHDGFGY